MGLSPTLQSFVDQVRGQALGDSNLITNLALFKAAIAELGVQTGVSVDWQDDGAAILSSGTANFVGAGVVVTNVGGIATIAIADTTFGGIDYEEEGAAVVTALVLNAVGVGGTISNVAGVATLTIPGTIPYQEEGAAVVTARILNFVGAGVTLSNIGGVATATILGGSGIAVQEEGSTIVAAAGTINFVGPRGTVTDVGGVGTVTLPAELPTLVVTHEEANDVDGGTTVTATQNQSTLNTVVKNTITGASLATNQITLPAGDYHLTGYCVGFRANACKARLRDTTTGPTTRALGSSVYADVDETAGSANSIFDAYFTLGVESVLELELFTEIGIATFGFGFGTNSGEVETYASLHFKKLD